MVSSGRHPKKPIAEALAAVRRPGLEVEEIHRGHRWGVLRCVSCGEALPLFATPRVPENIAKRVHLFATRHDHGEVG